MVAFWEKIMKIVIAPDSFKGSLSAQKVCDIVSSACSNIFPDAEIISLPVSDGGEGMVDCLYEICNGTMKSVSSTDPLGRPIKSNYLILEDGTAVIEMAAASGLPFLSEFEKNPMVTSSSGTGTLILDALDSGCKKIILGIGGSATVDGGNGMAQVLGLSLLDQNGTPISPDGGGLEKLTELNITNLDPRLKKIPISIACDVDNPLCGSNGSAAIYGPQKGATPKMVEQLDKNLAHFAKILKTETGIELENLSGIGAAGGLALPLVALCGANLEKGLDVIFNYLGFEETITNADFIITGEGRTDYQSAMGKVLSGVCSKAKQKNIPVICLSGALEPGYEALYDTGLTAAFATTANCNPLEWQLEHIEKNLYNSTINILNLLKIHT